MKAHSFTLLLLLLLFITSSFDVPNGWYIAGYTPKEFEMGIDPHSGQNGGNAATIKSKKNNPKGWGTLMQDFNPEKFLGKKVKMTAWMKTVDLKNKAGFWMRVDQLYSKQALAFDNMMKRPIKGTTDWTKYEIVLDVPSNASNIAYGALLVGGGQIWFDNFSFEIVDSLSPTTDLLLEKTSQQSEPFNMDFEK